LSGNPHTPQFKNKRKLTVRQIAEAIGKDYKITHTMTMRGGRFSILGLS